MAIVFCNYAKQLFYIILIVGVLGEKGDCQVKTFKYISLQKMVSAVAVLFGQVPRSTLQILLLSGRRWMLVWEYRTIAHESRHVS